MCEWSITLITLITRITPITLPHPTQTPLVHLHRLGPGMGMHRHNPQQAFALDARRRFGASRMATTTGATTACHTTRHTTTHPTPRPEMLIRLAHLVVRHIRRLTEHHVYTRMQIVHPSGQRGAIQKHVFAVLGARQVVDQIVATLAAREDVTQAIKECAILTALGGCGVGGVIQGDGVEGHPEPWAPYVG